MIQQLMSNPHYLAGSIVARMSVNIATLLWAVVVLSKENALESAGASYSWVVQHLNEDYTALCFGSLAIIQTLWLLFHRAPVRIGKFKVCNVGYGIMVLAWLFVLFNILLGPRPIQPTATASVSVIVLLALFAFVSNARSDGGGGGN